MDIAAVAEHQDVGDAPLLNQFLIPAGKIDCLAAVINGIGCSAIRPIATTKIDAANCMATHGKYGRQPTEKQRSRALQQEKRASHGRCQLAKPTGAIARLNLGDDGY
ncbi:hypothetical protein QZM68_18355 [Burkholderia gladioli]|nr:hypothetical protein [Burkholderia gladioli]MDN7601734.1 hypothetical protein [Burkholderia gladioli]